MMRVASRVASHASHTPRHSVGTCTPPPTDRPWRHQAVILAPSMVHSLSAGHRDEIVDVFIDAFYEYPVMRWVLGTAVAYDDRLHRLLTFFVSGRAIRGEPLLGIRTAAGMLAGAATMTRPESPEAPPAVIELREATWAVLGADARQRYETFTAATQHVAAMLPERHHHLNMIGVRRALQGRGISRQLLDAVHALAEADPLSAGVSLTTEHPPNVDLYRHMGYHVVGETRVADAFTSWTLFRSRSG